MWFDTGLPALPGSVLDCPECHPGLAQELGRVSVPGAQEQGWVVPSITVDQVAGRRIENAVEGCDKQPSARVGEHAVVGGSEHEVGAGLVLGGIGADQRAAQSHVQGCSHTFVSHIGHYYAQMLVGQRNEIVEIARRLAGRFQGGPELPTREVGQTRSAGNLPGSAPPWPIHAPPFGGPGFGRGPGHSEALRLSARTGI